MSKSMNYLAPGKLVDVNGHMMHVYGCGSGAERLVFMSGSGTPCPTLDFKPLWEKLSDKYRIIVVEKAGYGWSETAKISRSISTILEETRRALELAGEMQ